MDGVHASRTGLSLTLTVMLIATLWSASTSASSDLSERIASLKADYNLSAHKLSAVALPVDTKLYKNITLKTIVSAFKFGEVVVTNGRPVFDLPGMGRPFAVRGKLIVSDAEETSPKAAPVTFRLYTKGQGSNITRLWVIPVDVSRLPEEQRRFIDRHCGNAFACEATVYGRIGELEAERILNLFSNSSSVTTVIGLVGDHVRFHKLHP